ncbi:hypothetical protein DERF_010369 [Dermatophagoides farinae]|uniref:Uncharacterized protein n=1 Tax=Dermatophagoides farinae TaxID=6954 RepID=A0A922HX28_DERFA|nr:hypothetical protein DERF_010369 [Dermatophagoides farinae]
MKIKVMQKTKKNASSRNKMHEYNNNNINNRCIEKKRGEKNVFIHVCIVALEKNDDDDEEEIKNQTKGRKEFAPPNYLHQYDSI